jgi:hypothetical protein
MESFTLAELGLFCGTIGGVIVSLIFAVQKSRCEQISVCGGLFKCARKLKEEEEIVPPGSEAPQREPNA